MFSKRPTGMFSAGGENFACPSVRKKGRSLSQTSFLFTSNFINIPQSFELIDQKKTLAFAPSFKWHRSSDEDLPERMSVDYESSQNNFYLTSSASSTSNQNLLFITENESKPSQVSFPPNESRTDLSSSYKYNPIFPENQLYAENLEDKTSCPASYTSVRHHILENIPINLLSNLNIFLNENKHESLISSRSNFSRTNSVPSKNNHTNLTLSGSNVDYRNNLSRPKLESLKSFLNRSRTQNQSNHFSNASTHFTDCKYNDLIVLKPASDSVLASRSSESVISDLHLEHRSSSETTLESKSVNNADSDMRVHFINDSGSNVSDYSLLISKGYTFANKRRSKKDLKCLNYPTDEIRDSFSASLGGASNGIAETELCVVNFSEYNVDHLNTDIHRSGNSFRSEVRNQNLSSSQAHFEPEIFQSCNSEIKSSVASNDENGCSAQCESVNSNEQYVGGFIASAQNDSKLFPSKTEAQKWEKPPLSTSKDKSNILKCDKILKTGDTLPIISTEEVFCGQQNSSLRDTVKKISDRFLRLENRYISEEEESSSETYTVTGSRRKIKSDEDVRDSGSEDSYSDESDEVYYNNAYQFGKDVESTEYSCSDYQYSTRQKSKPKVFQRGKHKLKTTDFSSSQSSIAQFKSKPGNKISQNIINTKMEMQPRKMNKQKNLPIVSRSKLILRQRFSKYTVTSDSAYSNTNKTHIFSQRRKLKRSTTEECRKNSSEKKMFGKETLRQPNIRKKRSFQSGKLDEQWQEGQNIQLCHSYKAEKTHGLCKEANSKTNDCQKVLKINSSNSKQEILNFIERKIINLDKWKELRNSENQITSSYRNKKNCPNDKCDKVFVINMKGSSAEPEMDVYSKKKKRETGFKNKGGFTEKILIKNNVKSDNDWNWEKELNYNEMKPFRKVKGKTSKTEDGFKQDTVSANERKDSFHSCRKEESLSNYRKKSELRNDAKNSELPNSRKSCQSNYSLDSELASSYYPVAGKESTVDNAESDALISESTSEYINWAKNCLFSLKNEICGSTQFQVLDDVVDQACMESSPEAGDRANPHEKAHVTVQKNVSVIGDRYVEITSISVPEGDAKISNESMSTVKSKSVLSVIPEEKDGSVEKLKSPFLSQKNSAVTNVSKRSSSNSMLQQKLMSVSSKPSCYSHDSLMDKKESLQSARSSKSRKSQKLLMVCSESEGEYCKFQDEMKHYRKNIPLLNPPRIIPSSSTFTPDKSVTQIE